MASRGDIEAGKAHIRLYVENSALVKGLNDFKKRLQSVGADIMQFGNKLMGLGKQITEPMIAAVKQFAAVGDELDKMSMRTGVSVGALAELGFAAEQSGASMEQVERGLFGLSRAYFEFSRAQLQARGSTAGDAFKEIGLTIQDMEGLAPEEQLQKVADGLANIEDASVRGAVAQKLLGRSGRELLPMFENLAALRKEARDLGLAPTKQATDMAAAITDAMNRVRRTIGAVIFEIGAAVAPMLMPALNTIKSIAVATNKWVRENAGLVRTIFAVGVGLTAAGIAITTVGAALFGLGTMVGLAASAITALGTAAGLVATPLGAVVAVLAIGPLSVVASIALVAAKSEEFRDTAVSAFKDLLATVKSVSAGISNAFKAGDMQLAFEIGMAGLKVLWMDTLDHMLTLGIQWAEDLRGIFLEQLGPILEFMVSPTAAAAKHLSGLLSGDDKESGANAERIRELEAQLAEAKTPEEGISIRNQIVKAMREGSDDDGIFARRERERFDARQSLNNLTAEAIGKAREKAAEEAAAELAAANRKAPVKGVSFPDEAGGEVKQDWDAVRRNRSAPVKAVTFDDEEGRDEERHRLAQARVAAMEEARRQAEVDALYGIVEEAKSSTFGSFSGAAVIAAGNAGGPQDRVAKAAETTAEAAKTQVKKTDDVIDLLKKVVDELAGAIS